MSKKYVKCVNGEFTNGALVTGHVYEVFEDNGNSIVIEFGNQRIAFMPYRFVTVGAPEVQSPKTERDPTGKSQHEPGAKVDAGKVRPALVIRGFARALWKVSEVGTFGATKYTENGWTEVPNGEARYADAQMRHFLKEAMGEQVDPDSNVEHLAHEAWNALAKLDLALRRKEKEQA